jgi:hypothetical protein
MYSLEKNRVNKNVHKKLERLCNFPRMRRFASEINAMRPWMSRRTPIEIFSLRSPRAPAHAPVVLRSRRPGATRRAPFSRGPLAVHTLGALGLLLAAGCGGRGEARFGQRCERDADCQRGLCVGGVAGDAPVCTTSCGGRNDCPGGWSCNGVTQANVVVCSKGAATPFGEGER